jgi:hypothetical protein
MSYQGNKPPTSFESPKKDRFTGISGTTCSLTYPVSSVADILVWVNGVKQDFTNYSVSGSTLTLGGTLVSADIVEVTYVGRTYGSTAPTDASVGINQLSATGTKSSSTFLAGDNTFKTVSGTTINNNADNRVITGSGTANTLEGESGLTYDGTTLLYSKNDASVLKALEFKNLQADAGTVCGISFDFELDNTNANNSKAQIAVKEDAGDGYATIVFSTSPRSDSSTLEERMRISPSGVLGVGNTGTTGSFSEGYGCQIHEIGYIQSNRDGGSAGAFGRSNDGVVLSLVRGTGGVGSISVNSTSTAFNTSSDYRLKENEVAISDGITRLKNLKPYRFNFKVDKDKTVDGFFAHEVSSVVPEAIQGEKDAVDSDNNPIHQGIDQSKLVPLLTSALQEAITKIETLEARVKTLEDA